MYGVQEGRPSHIVREPGRNSHAALGVLRDTFIEGIWYIHIGGMIGLNWEIQGRSGL